MNCKSGIAVGVILEGHKIKFLISESILCFNFLKFINEDQTLRKISIHKIQYMIRRNIVVYILTWNVNMNTSESFSIYYTSFQYEHSFSRVCELKTRIQKKLNFPFPFYSDIGGGRGARRYPSHCRTQDECIFPES